MPSTTMFVDLELDAEFFMNLIRSDTRAIQIALEEVLAEDWENVEGFQNPRPEYGYTIIHLASYAGKLQVLEQAETAGYNLYITDKVGRCGLHYAATQGHVDIVKWLVERSTDELQYQLKDLSETTPLHLAVLHKQVKVVRFLVEDAGVNVNVRNDSNQTPLHLAGIGVDLNDPEKMSQYEEIVNIIVISEGFERIDDTSEMSKVPLQVMDAAGFVLNQAVMLNSFSATDQLLEIGLTIPNNVNTLPKFMLPLHIAAIRGFHKVLCRLLKRDTWTSHMINTREYYGNTPLHVAVTQCEWDCARTLISANGDLLTKNHFLGRAAVIDDIFRINENPLAFLTDILDAEVSKNETDTTACRTLSNNVILDFKLLLSQTDQRQMAVVSALIKNCRCMEEVNILQHPLIEAFLALKWRRTRRFFDIPVFVEIIFVILLVTYSTILLQTKRSSPGPAWILFVCACIQLFYNGLQFITMPIFSAKQPESWLSIISATLTVIVVIAEGSSDNYSMGSGFSWTIQLTGFAMLFACIQMVIRLGRSPFFGSYAFMFINVVRTAVKVFLAVGFIIYGFSLSFSVLFHYDSKDFDDPWKAFVKTIVMMTGEYDYSDLFSSTDKKNSSVDSLNSDNRETTFLSFISSVVFLAFIMLASICVMNLITGLAVSDTQGLVKEADVRRLLKQAKFLEHIELVTSHWIFESRLIPRCLVDSLKSRNKIQTPIRLYSRLERSWLNTKDGISEELLKRLFELYVKNQNHRQDQIRLQTRSSLDSEEKCFSEIILYLQERIAKLQRDKMRRQGIRTPSQSGS